MQEPVDWPTGRYRAIYADPPWNFRTFSAKGRGRSASVHYDCLDLTSLGQLRVGDLAAKDCALFMWVTDPMLKAGIGLMETWGFEYKTVAFCWAKLNKNSVGCPIDPSRFFMGTGYWTRANPELCLLGTRGSPNRLARNIRRLVISERREHSRKPDEVREAITRLVPGPYVELFARQRVAGWDCWGDEVGLFDNGPVPTRREPSAWQG